MYKREQEILSKALRAGRRTYFFDVKATKAEDYYLTITESKKFTNEDGSFHFKKHKIYLYKEDFNAFKSILEEMTSFIFEKKGEEIMVKITSERVAGPDDPIYTGRWVLSPISAPKKSKKENTKEKKAQSEHNQNNKKTKTKLKKK